MKIAIISDTHDNLANIKKAFKVINEEGIETVLHCGDVATYETLKEISNIFQGKVCIALGNMDQDYKLKPGIFFKKIEVVENYGEIEAGGKKIVFSHFPETAKELAKSSNYDIVFYGHTHKPWKEKVGATLLVNPGNLAGILYKATFAVYDTETNRLELKILAQL